MIPKFRAWDKINSEMCTVLVIDYQVEEVLLSDNYDGAWSEFDYMILMQSTGLKDKNDAEIYEGDIVKIENHPFHTHIQIDGNYEVGINERKELCAGGWLLYEALSYASVIGSIYENPELLEVAE